MWLFIGIEARATVPLVRCAHFLADMAKPFYSDSDLIRSNPTQLKSESLPRSQTPINSIRLTVKYSMPEKEQAIGIRTWEEHENDSNHIEKN